MDNYVHALNTLLQESNAFVAGIMVLAIAWGFYLFAKSPDAEPPRNRAKSLPKIYPGFPSALLCWLIWWLILLVVYSLIPAIPNPSVYWRILLLDGFGNIALLGTAACLRPKELALPPWKFVGYSLSLSLTVLSWNLLLGARKPTAEPGWKVLVSTPGVFLAVAAFILLAYTAAKCFTEFKVEIWLICMPYALLQGPAYYFILIDPTSRPAGLKVVECWLAIGKIMFILLFSYILLVRTKISEKKGITRVVINSLEAALVVLTLLSTFAQLRNS